MTSREVDVRFTFKLENKQHYLLQPMQTCCITSHANNSWDTLHPKASKNCISSRNALLLSLSSFLFFFLPCSRLESDVKKLKADLQSSRQTESDLRSEINRLVAEEKKVKSDWEQLQKENESLQTRLVRRSYQLKKGSFKLSPSSRRQIFLYVFFFW